MRILPRNREGENSRRGTWGGWAASELRLCAHLRLRKHNQPHRQKGPGARCASQATNSADRRARGGLEPQVQRPDSRLPEEEAVRVQLYAATETLFIRHPSLLQEPSPRDCTTHPPERCVRRSKRKPHHRHTLTFWQRGPPDLSITGYCYTTSTLSREKWQFLLFPFSFCFLSYFLVCCGFIINSSM